MGNWTQKKIGAWYSRQPYFVGANFIPSTAINSLEMWQAETFDPATIERELGLASQLGMNLMRVYLHDLLWNGEREALCERIDRYLAISAKLGIRTMLTLFDDCGRQTLALGRQPEPVPFIHNSGWAAAPGIKVVNDPRQWPRIESYVKGVLKRFKDDERVALWDLYNEPGNSWIGDKPPERRLQGEQSLPLLQAVFGWARSVTGLTQPITSGVWNFTPDFRNLTEFALAHSDIVTFHCYGPPQQLTDVIQSLGARGRPMICTEYMARTEGSTFEHCLPVLKQHNVGAIHWGLVAGRTQTIYPWEWTAEKGEPKLLFHDVFARDGSFLYPSEELAIKRITGAASISLAGQ